MFERYNAILDERAQGYEGGFTLIELLIVIVVLGILAAVTVFALSGVTSQSAVSACKADAKSVEVAVEAYHAESTTGAWPTAAQLTTADPVTGVKYLRTFPSSTHYTVTLDDATAVPTAAPGDVDVTPTGVAIAQNFDTESAVAPLSGCEAVK